MTVLETLHRIAGRCIDGTTIWDVDDWDICCILDGCRVDTFRQFHPDAESYRSVQSASKPWLRRTFDRDCSRVGYITANPFATDLDRAGFAYFHCEDVTQVDGVETVAPESLARRAATLWQHRNEFSVDQIVVHFMQPHVPFRSRPKWFDKFAETDVWGSIRWRALKHGNIDRDQWFDAYRDNLSWVLVDGVYPLLKAVDATIGVTSDHGNAAGEFGLYGHPDTVAVPSVRHVPWKSFEAERGGESELESVDLTQEGYADTAAQLETLGYK